MFSTCFNLLKIEKPPHIPNATITISLTILILMIIVTSPDGIRYTLEYPNKVIIFIKTGEFSFSKYQIKNGHPNTNQLNKNPDHTKLVNL